MIYLTMVQSILTYGLIVWGLGKKPLKHFIQCRDIIVGVSYSIGNLFKIHTVLTLEQLYYGEISIQKYIYKNRSNFKILYQNREKKNRNTTNENIIPIKPNTTSMQHLF